MQHWFLHRAAKGGTCASGGDRSEHIYVWVLSLSPSLSQPLSLSLSLEAAVLTCFVQSNACSGWVPCTCRGPLHVECMCRMHPYALKFELCPCEALNIGAFHVDCMQHVPLTLRVLCLKSWAPAWSNNHEHCMLLCMQHISSRLAEFFSVEAHIYGPYKITLPNSAVSLV